MAEEAPKYFALLTTAGAALEARALAEGVGVVLTEIAIGDANLQDVTPTPDVTELIHEVLTRPIECKSVDEKDANITNLHTLLPADVGGFWVRELGVYGHLEGSEEKVLYAYANHAPYYKMLPQSGQTSTHKITVPVVQCLGGRLEIQVADEGYASREALERLRAEFTDVCFAVTGLAKTVARLVDRQAQNELAAMASEDCRNFREASADKVMANLIDSTTKISLKMQED